MSKFNNFIAQSFRIPQPTLTEKNLEDQSGKVFIVTGGYTGVGYKLTSILYQKHGTVYVAGRSEEKGTKAIDALKKEIPNSKGRLVFLKVDLADLTTIKGAAEEFMAKEDRLDVLTNNAGVMDPPVGSKTAQGYELQMGTNCLGPFLFTQLLLPLIQKTAASAPPASVRVTWAASLGIDVRAPEEGVTFENGAAKVHNNSTTDYGQSKAGNVFLGTEFARRYGKNGIISNSWNPGNLKTELTRHTSIVFKTVVGATMLYPAIFGAYTELYAGWSKDITAKENGCYVIPWGRLHPLRSGLEASVKGQEEGGTGRAAEFWEWCEKETRKYK